MKAGAVRLKRCSRWTCEHRSEAGCGRGRVGENFIRDRGLRQGRPLLGRDFGAQAIEHIRATRPNASRNSRCDWPGHIENPAPDRRARWRAVRVAPGRLPPIMRTNAELANGVGEAEHRGGQQRSARERKNDAPHSVPAPAAQRGGGVEHGAIDQRRSRR